MEILFLGTSSMVPTKERNHSGILISYKNENILIDCGEGVQRQMKTAGAKLTKITKILVSHWHGDHVLGIPGLLQSMSASGHRGRLQIYGPAGTKKFMKKMFGVFVFDNKMNIEVIDVKGGNFFENDEFKLSARLLRHNIPTLGYSLEEKPRRKINLAYTKRVGIPKGPLLGKLQKGQSIIWKNKQINADDATRPVKGKKITIIIDTLPCKNADILAKNSDLLVCEATYGSDLEAKSRKHMHMTAAQAAKLAKKANAGKLVLTHFSARYNDTKGLEKDAMEHFKDVVCAKDFMKISL